MTREASTDSVAELRTAVSRAAQALRDGEPGGPEPSLDRPPKPELGDYSSNAAMLLAAPLGESPRDVAARLGAELERDLGPDGGVERIEVAGPGFVNLFLADSWYRRAMAGLAAAGESLGPAPTDVAGTDPGRVRLRQPDRPAARRRRPPRRLRRRAGAPARGGRPRGRPRVLRQRRRRPGRALRALDRGPDDRRRAARGRLQRRLRRRARRADRRRGDRPCRHRRDRPARRRAGPGDGAGDPRPLRRPLRHLVLRARPLQPRRGRGGAGAPRAGRALLPQRRRPLAAHDRVRRRQGPGADPGQRRADLPGGRRRLPLGQARARLRPADRRARRRPPRLRGRACARRSPASAPTRTASSR